MATDALDRLRAPHLNTARRAADYLNDVIADVRLALDAGRVPARRKIIAAAVDLERGITALEVIGETVRICQSPGDVTATPRGENGP